MRVRILEEKCSACGLCEDLCPGVFELGASTAQVLVEVVPGAEEACCREAAGECPEEAIEILEAD